MSFESPKSFYEYVYASEDLENSPDNFLDVLSPVELSIVLNYVLSSYFLFDKELDVYPESTIDNVIKLQNQIHSQL
ncbi:MAG: hypothetical protein AAGF07_03225 [Patescibacteria group bacterium]